MPGVPRARGRPPCSAAARSGARARSRGGDTSRAGRRAPPASPPGGRRWRRGATTARRGRRRSPGPGRDAGTTAGATGSRAQYTRPTARGRRPAGPFDPEGEAGAAVEPDPPRAGRLERHPHQHPDAGGDEAGHEGVGHREVGGEEQSLGGHREEGREAAGLGVEQIARERIGEQHGGDHRGGGGKHRGPLGHPPDRPGGQRDQPGQERWLVEVARPVEPGPEPVAAARGCPGRAAGSGPGRWW